MNAENESNGLSFWEAIANLEDMIPKPEVENPTAEFLTSNYSIPVIVTQVFNSFLQLRVPQTKNLWNASHDEVRLLPDKSSDFFTYQVGDTVEILVKDSIYNISGWAVSTIQSIVGPTYVARLLKNDDLVLAQKNNIRPITKPVYLYEKYCLRFEIFVPAHLRKFAKNVNVHQGLLKAIGDSFMHYDSCKNVLVIFACSESSGHLAKMLQTTHFTSITKIMLLQQNIALLKKRYESIINGNYVEQFKVEEDLIKFVIGKRGRNIKKAEKIRGITCVSLSVAERTVIIHSQTQDALDEARVYLKLEKETIQVPRRLISRIIGKNGNKIFQLTAKSKLSNIIIKDNRNEVAEFVNIDFIGTSENISHAKILLECDIKLFEEMEYLPAVRDDVYQQPRNPGIGSSVFGRQNQISEKSVDTSIREIPEFSSGRESTNDFPKINQNLVLNTGGRARGRPDYQTTMHYRNSSYKKTGSRYEIDPLIEARYASTSDVSDELERQRNQGSKSNHFTARAPDWKKNTEQISETSNKAAVRGRNFSLGKKWSNRYHPKNSAPGQDNPNGLENAAFKCESPRRQEHLDEDDKVYNFRY